MAIARVQKVQGSRAGGANSTTIGLTDCNNGALLVLTASVYNSGGTTISVSGASGTWSEAKKHNHPSDPNSQIHIWYCPNPVAAKGSSITITVDPAGSSADIDLTLSEYWGHDVAPLDKTSSNYGDFVENVATPINVSPGILSQADELIVAVASHLASNPVMTPDATYTQIGENENNATGQSFNAMDKIVASTASDQADWTIGTGAGTTAATFGWFAAIATFKAHTGDAIRFFPRDDAPDRLAGAVFGGSDTSESAGYTALYTQSGTPPRGWNYIRVSLGSYRYLRCATADGKYGTIAELEFYRAQVKVTGTTFGTAPPYEAGKEYTAAFDGLTNTYFEGLNPNGQYCGIDTGGGPPPGQPAIKRLGGIPHARIGHHSIW